LSSFPSHHPSFIPSVSHDHSTPTASIHFVLPAVSQSASVSSAVTPAGLSGSGSSSTPLIVLAAADSAFADDNDSNYARSIRDHISLHGVAARRCSAADCQHEESPDHLLNACSRCLTSVYCSQECQKKDWKTHRNRCQQLKAEFIERHPEAARYLNM